MIGKRVRKDGPDLREPCATTGAPKFAVRYFGEEHLEEDGSLSKHYRPDCDLIGWRALAREAGVSERQIRNDMRNLARNPRYAEVRSALHVHLECPARMYDRKFLIPMTHSESWAVGIKRLDAFKSKTKPHWGRSTAASAGDLISSPFDQGD